MAPRRTSTIAACARGLAVSACRLTPLLCLAALARAPPRVNCSFYFKIGACRHGDRCSRLHNKPKFSQTILIANMYQNPTHITGNTLTEEQLQLHFEQFYEDVFTELSVNYGEIEEMYVCDNVGDHLIGNVYVRFRYEEDAQKAVDSLNNRFYAGIALRASDQRRRILGRRLT